jgi:hydrogenase maturation factor
VRLGPTPGVDFDLRDVGGRAVAVAVAVAVATDPVSILPPLGVERAGRFALDVILADVAVSGLPPARLAVPFSPPPSRSPRR